MPQNGTQLREEPTVPQWVCTHCYIHLVNGDCTEPDTCSPGSGDEDDPLHLFEGMHVTPGMTQEYHSCGREDDTYFGECDCERRTYSTSACNGCGSWLHGEREAVTGWVMA